MLRKNITKRVINIILPNIYNLKFFSFSPIPLLTCSNLYWKPVFFRCKRTKIFFIIFTEGIICTIKIYYDLPVGQRFYKKVTPPGIGLSSRCFILKWKKKFPSSKRPIYLKNIFFTIQFKFKFTVFDVFLSNFFVRGKRYIDWFWFDWIFFNDSYYCVFKVNWIVIQSLEFFTVRLF